jgi:hypothetical protein
MRDHTTRLGTVLGNELTESHDSWLPPAPSGSSDAGGLAARDLKSSPSAKPIATPTPTPTPPPPHSPKGIKRTIHQRRREPRLQPVEDRIWMQWWEDGELLGRSARLINISRHGSMIITSALLRPEQMVRVYLEEPAPQVGVGASVLQVVEGLHGVHQLRLGFTEPCPDMFLEAAAGGFEAWLQRDVSRV